MFRFRSALISAMTIAALFAPAAVPSAPAEQVSFVRDYTYHAGEADSKLSSRAIALEQVKRLLLEQVGTFVRSETQVREFQLTKDEVVTLTAGIVSVEILKEEWDGERYALTARVAVDPQQVAEAVDHLRGNAVERAELEQSRRQNEASLKEIEQLRTELDTLRQEAKGSGEQTAALKRKEQDYARSTEAIALNNLMERGAALLELGDHEAAFEAFDQAVAAAPGNARAYLGRAAALARMDKKTRAFQDIDRALKIDPGFAKAFVVRAKMLRRLGRCGEAVRQTDRAIKMNPEFAEAYFERGLCRLKLRERQEGMDDLKRAANMGLRRAQEVLSARGVIY